MSVLTLQNALIIANTAVEIFIIMRYNKKAKKDESGFTEIIAVRIKVRKNNDCFILTNYRSLVII